jgi:hypothetical protein
VKCGAADSWRILSLVLTGVECSLTNACLEPPLSRARHPSHLTSARAVWQLFWAWLQEARTGLGMPQTHALACV